MVLFLTGCQSDVKLAHAKNIDYTPDVTSDTYWETHHICIVRVANRERDQEGKEQLTYQMVRQISEGSMGATRTVKLSDLWFGMGDEDTPRISVNDSLILYFATQGPTPIVTVKLAGKIEGDARVNALLQIAKFRANEGGVPAVKEGVFSKEGVVALYSLKRLMNLPRFESNADYIARLTALRADEQGGAEVRILASRLAERLGGRPLDSEQDYIWLKTALAQTREPDWVQLRPFVDRLLDFRSKRAESAVYLTALVKDQDKPESVRIAAYSSFDDPRLFNFSAPDAESERVFNTCIEMLKDSQELIRRAGAALLHNISIRVDLKFKQAYVQRAKSAVEATVSIEKNDDVRLQMQNYLKMLSQ